MCPIFGKKMVLFFSAFFSIALQQNLPKSQFFLQDMKLLTFQQKVFDEKINNFSLPIFLAFYFSHDFQGYFQRDLLAFFTYAASNIFIGKLNALDVDFVISLVFFLFGDITFDNKLLFENGNVYHLFRKATLNFMKLMVH